MLDVEAELAELAEAEQKAKRQIAEIDARRNALLISDDDKSLDADEIARLQAVRTLDKAKLAQPALIERLKAAQDRARAKLEAELAIEEKEHIDTLRTAMNAAIDANEAAIAFIEKRSALLGPHAASTSFAFPLLRRLMVETWEDFLVNNHLMDRPKAAAPIVSLPKLPPLRKQKPKPAPPAVPYAEKLRRPATPQPENGMIRLAILRSGIELPDGGQSRIGDIVDYPDTIAHALMGKGAADFAPPDAVPTQAEPVPDRIEDAAKDGD
ncbi:hypothetical protein [Rhizobium rhizosphaerae]|uniref:hypothetical protein n=1 Tax=Xaviernesmea rhizosphaerae TaxID=1672749 RepID=UPI001118888B|nr:hypothetical protein [Xaviernesmea rhizosphaerae]